MTKARDLANGGFGLILVKPSSVVNGTDNGKGTVSFSAQTSVSLNNCFNSIYQNYRVILSVETSGAGHIQIRYRNSNSDNTTSNYFSGYVNTSLASGTITGDPAGAASNIMSRTGYSNGAGVLTMFYDIYNPFLAKATGLSAIQSRNDAFVSGIGGFFQAATSFDGITFIPSAGNITGEVSVYGYNK
jgi:hypothetical protein